jgi:hypothetical protein
MPIDNSVLKKLDEYMLFRNQYNCLELLKKYPELIHYRSNEMNEFFLLACGLQLFDVVNYFIKHGTDVHQRNAMNRNAIFYAIYAEDLSLLKKMHDLQVDLEEMDTTGKTPLLVAAYFGYTKIVRYLIENGANVNQKDSKGQNLFYHIESGNCYLDITYLMNYYDKFDVENQRRLKKLRLKYVFENGSV